MSDQLSLLDSPAARASDPPTSAAAVPNSNQRETDCARVLHAIERFHAMHGKGCTAYEVQTYLADPDFFLNCVSRRITDLTKAGLVEAREITRPGGKGKRQIAWFPTGASPP